MQEQLESFLNKEICWNLKRLQKKLFKGANKLGRYLAWQSKKRRQTKIINKIADDGKETVDHNRIKRAFKNVMQN